MADSDDCFAQPGLAWMLLGYSEVDEKKVKEEPIEAAL